MKSNYMMVLEMDEVRLQRFGFITNEEADLIRELFKIQDRSDVELQNLRDFIVLYYDENIKDINKMSAITAVIDDEKFKRGMEV